MEERREWREESTQTTAKSSVPSSLDDTRKTNARLIRLIKPICAVTITTVFIDTRGIS